MARPEIRRGRRNSARQRATSPLTARPPPHPASTSGTVSDAGEARGLPGGRTAQLRRPAGGYGGV